MTAQELRSARASLGLTVNQLAMLVGGANRRTVRRWEAEHAPLPIPEPVASYVDAILRREAFVERAVVRLVLDYQSQDGTVETGSTGVVLKVLGHGAAYLVEFEGPPPLCETVLGALLDAA